MESQTKDLMRNLLVNDLLPDLDKYCVESNNPKIYIVCETSPSMTTMSDNMIGAFSSFKGAVMCLLANHKSYRKHTWNKDGNKEGNKDGWSYSSNLVNNQHVMREIRLNEDLQMTSVYYLIKNGTMKRITTKSPLSTYNCSMFINFEKYDSDYEMEMFEEFKCFDFTRFASVSGPIILMGAPGAIGVLGPTGATGTYLG